MAGTVLESGSVVEALVLDVAKAERLVDLTLKPEFFNSSQESSISRTNKKVSILSCPSPISCLLSHIHTLVPRGREKTLVNFLIQVICGQAMEPSLCNYYLKLEISGYTISFFSPLNIPFLNERKIVWIFFLATIKVP